LLLFTCRIIGELLDSWDKVIDVDFIQAVSTTFHINEKTFLVTHDQTALRGYYWTGVHAIRTKKEHFGNLWSKVCLLISQNEGKVWSVLWSVLCEKELFVNWDQAQTQAWINFYQICRRLPRIIPKGTYTLKHANQ